MSKTSMSKPPVEMEIVFDAAFLEGRERQRKHREQSMLFAVIATAVIWGSLMCVSAWLYASFSVALDTHRMHGGQWLSMLWRFLALAAFVALTFWTTLRLVRIAHALNFWRRLSYDYFCPRCQFHLPTHLSYTCPRCATVNGSDSEYSYFLECRTCHQPHDAILCPRCRRTLALTKDEPLRCIAVPVGRQSQSS